MKLTKATKATSAVQPEEIPARMGEGYGHCWLDSSLRFGDRGRYSFLARNPVAEICLEHGSVSLARDGRALTVAPSDSLPALVERLAIEENLFAIGYIGWEATLPWLDLVGRDDPDAIPEARFVLYESVLRFDHARDEYTATNPDADDYADLLAVDSPTGRQDYPLKAGAARVQPCLSHSEYLERVQEVKHYIREGDIYQANFTSRFDVTTDLQPMEAYRRLRRLNPAPYSAWLDFGDYRILSSSPERMFKRAGDLISTSPIKGTIARGESPDEERENTQRLLSSAKDGAELLMIVDLERNDLGRIAQVGSVKVNSLHHTEKYSSVIHLVSDISARLRGDVDFDSICRAMLPGGSISGAPKKRAAEIINQLENRSRSVYTGCIGYLSECEADFNIAIRTMLHRGDTYHVHAGGGIVADSDPNAEYDEMMLKANNLFRALGVTA